MPIAKHGHLGIQRVSKKTLLLSLSTGLKKKLPYAWEITSKCTCKEYKCKITVPLVVSYLSLHLHKISDSKMLNKQMYVNINITYWVRTMLQPRTCIFRVNLNYIRTRVYLLLASHAISLPQTRLVASSLSASTTITFDATKHFTKKGPLVDSRGIKWTNSLLFFEEAFE